MERKKLIERLKDGISGYLARTSATDGIDYSLTIKEARLFLELLEKEEGKGMKQPATYHIYMQDKSKHKYFYTAEEHGKCVQYEKEISK